MQSDLCRVIGILDVDSFECQIWQNKHPQYKNHPCVVANEGGRILSVSHEAKEFGITRDLKVEEAKRKCYDLKVFTKPDKFKKPNSGYNSEPRAASSYIQNCIVKSCKKKKITVERVPMDEWYLDLTNCVDYRIAKAEQNEEDPIPGFDEDEGGSTVTLESKRKLNVNKLLHKMQILERKFPMYTSEEQRLVIGAGIIYELIESIYQQTEFVCSGGVSYNKLLAKQACKLHKPKALTILSSFGLERVSKIIQVRDIHGLGGDLGQEVSERLPFVETMWDLKKLNVERLTNYYRFDSDVAEYLYDLARGICEEDVVRRWYTDSVNCGKNNLRIRSNKHLRSCLNFLSDEMIGRLAEELTEFRRMPNSMKIKFSYIYEYDRYSRETTIERTIDYYDDDNAKDIAQECFMEIKNWGFNPYDNDGTMITKLTISANKFEKRG